MLSLVHENKTRRWTLVIQTLTTGISTSATAARTGLGKPELTLTGSTATGDCLCADASYLGFFIY